MYAQHTWRGQLPYLQQPRRWAAATPLRDVAVEVAADDSDVVGVFLEPVPRPAVGVVVLADL